MQEESTIAGPEEPKTRWRAFDPAYVVLVIAATLASTYLVKVSRKNSALQIREIEYSGTLCGPQTTQVGDIVPAFKTVDCRGARLRFSLMEQKNLFFSSFLRCVARANTRFLCGMLSSQWQLQKSSWFVDSP